MKNESVESHRATTATEPNGPQGEGGLSPSGRGFRKTLLEEKLFHEAARKTIRVACQSLLPDGNARVLELLAGPLGVMPREDPPNLITGVGNWPDELCRNDSLSHRIVADLNADPVLPFRGDSFDGAALFFGLETLCRPEEVFGEVSRVLKHGAVFLVVYSSVTDAAHAHSTWNVMDDQERLSTVVSYFESARGFGPVTAYGTKKRVRSEASRKKRPRKELASIWIAYAKSRWDESRAWDLLAPLERRNEEEADQLRCPYCDDRLKKYEVPHSVYEIDYWYEADYLYICFNDSCPYFERGWEWMWSQMRRNVSYRHMYNPTTRKSGPIPVPTNYALRDGIVDEG
jgi:SAM-dependent methyltransferase